MLAPLLSIIEKEWYEKSLLATIWRYGKFTHQSVPIRSMNHNERAKGQIRFIFSMVLRFTECFKQKDSVIDTCAINAVTKSSMKHEAAVPQIVT